MPESVNTESVTGDSAIGSPDSWEESEYAVSPEKFCESRSDSSLCDSGTSWDLYRATPVEVTALDEGFAPGMDRTSDDQSITESNADEGIFSLSSLECAQERISEQMENKQQEKQEVKEEEMKFENDVEDLCQDLNPGQNKDQITAPAEPEPPLGLHGGEKLFNSGGEDHFETDPTNQSHHSSDTEQDSEEPEKSPEEHQPTLDLREEDVKEPLDDTTDGGKGPQVTDSPSVGRRMGSGGEVEVLKEEHEEIIEAQHEPDLQTHTETPTEESNSDEFTYVNIPPISKCSEAEDVNEEETSGPDGRDPPADGPAHPAELMANSREPSCDTPRDPAETVSCPMSGRTSAQSSEKVHLSEPDTEKSHADVQFAAATDEQESPLDISDLIHHSSSSEAEAPSVKPEQDMDSTHRLDERRDKPQTLDSDDLQPNGELTGSCYTLYEDLDQRSPIGDLTGDLLEPMDLFYPDKEEPVFSELPDNEMQSWPSVLSVSALQPAPASEPLQDQTLDLLDGDASDGGGRTEELDETQLIPDVTSGLQEQHFLSADGGEGLGSAPASSDDGSESQQPSPGRLGENTEPVRWDIQSSITPGNSHIPPVLRHRKGVHFYQTSDHQRAANASSRKAADSDVWGSDSWEMYLVLLLWLLLYCFWLLPQMDLKSLPSQLLNLH
ncbi:unnamed protein product [Lampetra planeri]